MQMTTQLDGVDSNGDKVHPLFEHFERRYGLPVSEYDSESVLAFKSGVFDWGYFFKYPRFRGQDRLQNNF